MDENRIKLLLLALSDTDRFLGEFLKNPRLNPDMREALQSRRNMNAEIFAHLGDGQATSGSEK